MALTPHPNEKRWEALLGGDGLLGVQIVACEVASPTGELDCRLVRNANEDDRFELGGIDADAVETKGDAVFMRGDPEGDERPPWPSLYSDYNNAVCHLRNQEGDRVLSCEEADALRTLQTLLPKPPPDITPEEALP